MYGYLLGFLLSAVIAGVAVYLMFVIAVFMALNKSYYVLPVLLVIGSYLLATFGLAKLAQIIFDSDQWLAFALNVSSVVFVMFLVILRSRIRHYAGERKQARKVRRAYADAPYIHLKSPFVKKVQVPDGGVALFIHVSFTVSRVVRSTSLMILAPARPERDIQISSNPYCGGNTVDPPNGFHLFDREYTDSPRSNGTKIMSEELEPDKRYFLVRVLYFSNSGCRLSDFEDFDVKQLDIKLKN